MAYIYSMPAGSLGSALEYALGLQSHATVG